MKAFRQLCGVLLCLWAEAVWAHPHVWITVTVEPLSNAAGELTALRQRWVFDPLYSAVFIDEMAKMPEAERAERWKMMEERTLAPLQTERFYTHPKAAFGEARDTRFYQDGDELVIEAELPLLNPTKSLHYQIYEPGYYVEILHDPKQRREFGRCTLSIGTAEPDNAKQEEAAALDQNENAGYDLGRYFAEQAELLCR